MIGDEDGERCPRAKCSDALGGQGLEACLKGEIERKEQLLFPRSASGGPVGEVGRMMGEGAARIRKVAGQRKLRFSLAQAPGLGQAVDNPVPGTSRLFREAVWPPRFRRLRQGDQQGGFGGGQAPRLLAQPRQRGRADSLDIAAIGSEREVELEDLLLGEGLLEPQCVAHLDDLGAQAAVAMGGKQPRHLHGEGRGAGNDPPMRGPLPGGAQDGERVDPRVAVEAGILIGDQHLDEARIDLLQSDRQTPATVGDGKGAEQAARAIQDLARGLQAAGSFQDVIFRRDEEEGGGEQQKQAHRQGQQRPPGPLPSLAHGRGPSTST